jgi:hypothetical protein
MKSLSALLLFVPRVVVVSFMVHPSSFNSYPINNDNAPDEVLRAESERIQTRLREQLHVGSADSVTTPGAGVVNHHHDVDRSKFERILVQLAAEYVQETTELCKEEPEEESDEQAIVGAVQPQRSSSDGSPSMINERLPAFLKPIPSNSSRPTHGLLQSAAAAAADSSSSLSAGAEASSSTATSSGPPRLGKRQRVSRFLSALNPFRGKGVVEETDDDCDGDNDGAVVDIDDCPSWA